VGIVIQLETKAQFRFRVAFELNLNGKRVWCVSDVIHRRAPMSSTFRADVRCERNYNGANKMSASSHIESVEVIMAQGSKLINSWWIDLIKIKEIF
jgi:hypothetical protein